MRFWKSGQGTIRGSEIDVKALLQKLLRLMNVE